MPAERSRIKHKIVLPSIALSQFLHKALFDEATFALFMENTAGALQSSGIELEENVTEDALMRLRFLVERARDFVIKERINSAKFEEIFGITVLNPRLLDVSLQALTLSKTDTSSEIYYSEQNSESNRGSSTDFNNSDAVNDAHSDHYSNTSFGGLQYTLPEERFSRVPLLDSLSLGVLIAKIDSQLKELGPY